jgi:hypothetical protein
VRRKGKGINWIEEGEDHAAWRAPRRDFRPKVDDNDMARQLGPTCKWEKREKNGCTSSGSCWATGLIWFCAETLPRGALF